MRGGWVGGVDGWMDGGCDIMVEDGGGKEKGKGRGG